MAKSYLLAFASLFLLALSSCQSLEQLSIDYLQAADLSFPSQLRKVAVVNNTGNTPDNKLITQSEKINENSPIVSRATAYANGDTRIVTESLAQELAHQNYFDEVVICDSALRANDKLDRESTLSQEEVRQLASDLGVDVIIAVENVQFKATKTVCYLNEFNCFQGAVDVKAYPSISIYLPERSRPMSTLHLKDSIFWEVFGGSAVETTATMIADKELLQEAAEFAGVMPVKYIVPTWKKEARYLYTGGSVPMRDAAVYVREKSWDDAHTLWLQAFESTKSKKKKMRAAHNIAVYYEMKDSLPQAQEWEEKAQQLAKDTEGKKIDENVQTYRDDVPNYYLISLYLAELKERNSQLTKLKMQMNRFQDNF